MVFARGRDTFVIESGGADGGGAEGGDRNEVCMTAGEGIAEPLGEDDCSATKLINRDRVMYCYQEAVL